MEGVDIESAARAGNDARTGKAIAPINACVEIRGRGAKIAVVETGEEAAKCRALSEGAGRQRAVGERSVSDLGGVLHRDAAGVVRSDIDGGRKSAFVGVGIGGGDIETGAATFGDQSGGR